MIFIKTQILDGTKNGIEKAAQILKDGGLCAIPTETVYGLAANALNADAVNAIFAAKGRPADNPLIVHIAELSELEIYASSFPEKAKKLTEQFWPGPLTVILPKTEQVPSAVTCGMDTVAIRMPSHPIAREIIKQAGVGLAAPSANRSGRPSPTTVNHVLEDMDKKIDAIVDGGDCKYGLESTVISFIGDIPRLLRPGAVTPEQITEAIGEIIIDEAVTAKLKPNQQVLSPGTKYKHYAPKAQVKIIKGTLEQFCKYVSNFDKNSTLALCFENEPQFISLPCLTYGKCNDESSQAQELFGALHAIDEMENIKLVFARCPEIKGVGLAVYNRLLRAAGFEVIEL